MMAGWPVVSPEARAGLRLALADRLAQLALVGLVVGQLRA